MKNKDYKNLITTCLVCLLPILIGILFYNKLPDHIAIHFDINNNPDDYFSKSCYVFLLPIILTMIHLFIYFKSTSLNNKSNKMPLLYIWVTPITSIVMSSVTTMYALGNQLNIRKVVMIILGILLILFGNYNTKNINNKFNKVQKRLLYFFKKKYNVLYEYLLTINGILFILSILFNEIVSLILVVLMILEILFLYLYALMIRK